MDTDITICTAILQYLSDNFGKDTPAGRLKKCIEIAGSVEACHTTITHLSQMSLLHVVAATDLKTGETIHLPVLNENAHKRVERYGAINVLNPRQKLRWK